MTTSGACCSSEQAAAAQAAEPLLLVFAASLTLPLLSHAVLLQTTFEFDALMLTPHYD
jgi:hypothetical protein